MTNLNTVFGRNYGPVGQPYFDYKGYGAAAESYGPYSDFYLKGSVVWDPGNLVDGAGETSALITVTGAAFGDYVMVAAPYDLQDCTVTGYVQAANKVEIRLQNESGGAKDLASGTWKVRVVR